MVIVDVYNSQNEDKYATHIENMLRAKNGILLRTHYSPGAESTRVIEPIRGIKAIAYKSLFYKKTVTINGKTISTTPYIY